VRYLVVSCLLLSLACAGGGPPPAKESGGGENSASVGRVAGGFPSSDALDALTKEPLPKAADLGKGYRDVDRWELAGPFPDAVSSAPRSGRRPWDALVDEFVAHRAGLVVATESMDCFAREVGRFLQAEHGAPGVVLQRFIAGRCGVATPPPSFETLGWGPTQARDAEEAVAQLGDAIAKRLAERVVGGPLELGVWLAIGDARVDMIIATGERRARVEPIATSPGADGRIEIEGELLLPATSLGGSVTRGRFEWAECESDAGVMLPRFRLRCPVAADDATAWIAVEYRPPERLLGQVALHVLVRPQGGELRRFERAHYTETRNIDDPAELTAALLELLNDVRRDAGLAPLALDAAQSEVAARLAPYYFSGLVGQAPHSVADLVALGMMAGWEVDGIVQQGTFAWAWLVQSRDLGRLLSDALQDPGARKSLLARDAERIALGARFSDAGADAGAKPGVDSIAVIAATYSLFSEATHHRDVETVRAVLTRARAARSRKPPGSLDAAEPLTSRAAARVQGGEEPRYVLADLISEGAERLHRSVVGWMAETQDLDTLAFPDDFIDRDDLDVAIAVPARKPEGEPWGRYVVLLLAAEPPQRRL